MTAYLAEYAWVGGRVEPDVRIEVADGRFGAVTPGSPDPSATRLTGLVLPGLANAHSHAFHRALRGRTHHDRGSFWTWRELMYRVAGRLDPDNYFTLARAVYGEMALAGITCVGEFHYLHHGPDGTPYADPNAMGHALIAAAAAAGIRITLLDTVYLTAGVDGTPLDGVQRRFSDGSYDGWHARFDRLRGGAGVRIGAALHSVRAAPVEGMATFARRTDGLPVHVHLSEQPAENEQCQAVHGCSPAELLDTMGVWQPMTTAVHATHLTDADRDLLAGQYVCLCPTTERDLADGIGPARALADAGATLTLGSDSHAVIDLFEEARGVELDERLATRRRGHFGAGELLRAATATGHASLGWPDAGEIATGQRADLVAVSLSSARTAGIDPAGVLFAATAADVTDVVVDGRPVVTGGRHHAMDVPRLLRETIEGVLR
ncbi:formimidoylglutamate deiminase [Actinoplanes teichomyceticus]|uniref:Formiminoglutamate deiminase n=1 Tax=Actinoplanes teichomyceticus TaxID=1867 RepID=A0A561VGP4_ACTTI|nr:formimidoylglutamate deiminase [Actinoplanes teichomyceticus]TWG10744.1 formiminoglutamate deiminase [Actinoplanes teichomyceticus]GIF12632.1 formimidoylglutamate deiminase [Actinoplanes teichomyceticus]